MREHASRGGSPDLLHCRDYLESDGVFFVFVFVFFFFFHNQDSKSSLFITSDPTTSYRLQKQSCRLLSPPTGAWAPQSAEKDPTEGEAVVDMADELLGLLLLSLYS